MVLLFNIKESQEHARLVNSCVTATCDMSFKTNINCQAICSKRWPPSCPLQGPKAADLRSKNWSTEKRCYKRPGRPLDAWHHLRHHPRHFWAHVLDPPFTSFHSEWRNCELCYNGKSVVFLRLFQGSLQGQGEEQGWLQSCTERLRLDSKRWMQAGSSTYRSEGFQLTKYFKCH